MNDFFSSPAFRDIATLIPLAAIVAILIYRKAAKEWPWIIAFCACEAIQRIGELYRIYAYAHQPSGFSTRQWHLIVYPRYFYSYWIAEVLGAIASLGILVDIKRSVPAAKYIPKSLTLTLTAFAACIAALCIPIVSKLEPHSLFVFTDTVLLFSLGVSLAPLIFSLVFAYSLSKLGFGFQANQLWIILLLLVHTLHHSLFAFLRISRMSAFKAINKYEDFFLIPLFIAWAWFLMKPTEPICDTPLPTEMQQFQQAILAIEAPRP